MPKSRFSSGQNRININHVNCYCHCYWAKHGVILMSAMIIATTIATAMAPSSGTRYDYFNYFQCGKLCLRRSVKTVHLSFTMVNNCDIYQ